MRNSYGLSDFEAANEDHLDLLLGFDDHAFENLPYDLIIIADWVIRKGFYAA